MYWCAVGRMVWRDVNSQVRVHQARTLDCSEMWNFLQKLVFQVWRIRMRMNGSQFNEKCSVTAPLEWYQVFVRSLSTPSLVCFNSVFFLVRSFAKMNSQSAFSFSSMSSAADWTWRIGQKTADGITHQKNLEKTPWRKQYYGWSSGS